MSSSYATYPSLKDRVILISGGASGIGASIVEAFVHQGSRVVFLDLANEPHQRQAVDDLLSRLSSFRHAPIFLPCDLTSHADLRHTAARIASELGPVDVLINNAGNDTRHALEDVTPELWDHLLAVNLRHYFFLTQAILPGMRSLGRGSIVNMSSISWAIPSTGLPVYVTAKAAIVGLTRTLAHELGPHNIRVNCVMPGAVATERQRRLWLTPEYQAEILASQALKRLIEPEEVARLVLFLASDDSSAITSQSHVIDAGWI
jgi:D-xylose 1-dehydrogenase